MIPEIASLHERMAKGGNWRDFQEEIAILHQRATTQDEHVELLKAHNILRVLIDEVHDADTAAKLHPIAKSEYKLFLMKEAMEGGDQANPAMLDLITRREVEAGRLDPHDSFRQLAQDGGLALGDSAKFPTHLKRRGNTVFFAVAAIGILMAFTHVKLFGLSPLWLILVGFVAGWWFNEQERKSHVAGVAKARGETGYR